VRHTVVARTDARGRHEKKGQEDMTMANDQRRRLLRGLTAGGLLLPMSAPALARMADPRAALPDALTMRHLHTGEFLAIPADPEELNRRALSKVNVFLRDHYSGDVGVIDPALQRYEV